MQKNGRLIYLLKQVEKKHIKEEEIEELLSLLEEDKNNDTIKLLNEFYTVKSDIVKNEQYNQQYWEKVVEEILEKERGSNVQQIAVKKLSHWKKWGIAAASILLVLTINVFLLVSKRTKTNNDIVAGITDIEPGTTGAILTLADGTKVLLDKHANGIISEQAGTKVVLENNLLVYKVQEHTENTAVAFNTVTTPNGRQFQLTLPDGSHVWLNAGSSITYPTTFSEFNRKVTVTGEIFFDIIPLFSEAKIKRPFIVNVNNKQTITVLGTQFNVNAYNDEKAIITSLLEGSVALTDGRHNILLKPGQQAIQQKNINVKTIEDIEQIIAWKNGNFNFNDNTLEEAIRQLERWYDVKAVYENGIPEIPFSGEISKGITLSELLKLLNNTKLKFSIDNRRNLIITHVH